MNQLRCQTIEILLYSEYTTISMCQTHITFVTVTINKALIIDDYIVWATLLGKKLNAVF